MTDSPPPVPPPPPNAVETNWETIDPREVLAYDAKMGTYRASFEREQATIGETIILVVATVTQTTPLELPLLYPVLDPERVEQLVDTSVTGLLSGDLHLSFTYADCRVIVHSHGLITVRPLEEDATD